MESKLERMTLDPRSTRKEAPPILKSKSPVAESWDEDSASDTDIDVGKMSPTHESSIPSAPPPTPITASGFPTWETGPSLGAAPSYSLSSRDRGDQERKRPEKSTAVAGRLIAGALGVKAPKKTEEQRAYDRSIKEQEIKRKNREKAAKEQEKLDAEKAKNAVWDG